MSDAHDSFISYQIKQADGFRDLLYRETKSRRKRLGKKLILTQWDQLLKSIGDKSKDNSNIISYMTATGKTIPDLNRDINRVYDELRLQHFREFYPTQNLEVQYDVSGEGNPVYIVRFALYV